MDVEKLLTELNLALSVYQNSLKLNQVRKLNNHNVYANLNSLVDSAKNCFYHQLDETLNVSAISFHLDNGMQLCLAENTTVSGFPILIFDLIKSSDKKYPSSSVHVFSISKITLN